MYNKYYLNLKEYLSNFVDLDLPSMDHITYNPSLKMSDCDIFKIKQFSYDSSELIKFNMIFSIMDDLIDKRSYSRVKGLPQNRENLTYEIGSARIIETHPKDQYNMRCRIRVPVIIHYN